MKKQFLVCILFLICTIGCGNANVKTESTTTALINVTDSSEQTTSPDNEKSGKDYVIAVAGEGDAIRLGVDKTLVWIAPYVLINNKESFVNALNDKLVNEYGCDFVVEIHAYDISMNFRQDKYSHADMIVDMMNNAQQADIIFSGNFSEYDDFIDEGVYYVLNEYMVTDEGTRLYEAYAPEIWKMAERNSEIYGVYSAMQPANMTYCSCNIKLAQKYGIDIPTGEWTFYDLKPILEKATIKNDKMDTGEYLLVCSQDGLLEMEGYYELYNFQTGLLFKKDEENKWVAVNPAEEEKLIKLWETIKEYKDNGWYETFSTATAAKSYNYGKTVFDIVAEAPGGINKNDDKYVNYDGEIISISVGKKVYAPIEPRENSITGIASWSEYKEEALKLLTLIHTDKELSELITYGIEGTHFKESKGILKKIGQSNDTLILPGSLAEQHANINKLRSLLIDPEDKVEYSKKLSSCFEYGPTMLYDIEMEGYEEQMGEIEKIYYKFADTLFSGESDDITAMVNDMNAALKAAGIEKIIEVINGQIREQEKNEVYD